MTNEMCELYPSMCGCFRSGGDGSARLHHVVMSGIDQLFGIRSDTAALGGRHQRRQRGGVVRPDGRRLFGHHRSDGRRCRRRGYRRTVGVGVE